MSSSSWVAAIRFRGARRTDQDAEEYLPKTHYLVVAVSKTAYKEPLERLFALRNFAAHESSKSKKTARAAIGTNTSAAGAWLKRQDRFKSISGPLSRLAAEIEAGAPY